MLSLLASYFLTGNETEDARNLFEDMYMGEDKHTHETFPEFKARFQSAAVMGNVPESEWFRTMWTKLTPQLRKETSINKALWKGDYRLMVQALTAYDLERRRNTELSARLPQKLGVTPKKVATTPYGGTTTYKPTNPLRTGAPTFKPTIQAKRPPDQARTITPFSAPVTDLICFNCKKPGHIANVCPDRTTIRKLLRDDPESEEICEEVVEHQDIEDEVEENDEA